MELKAYQKKTIRDLEQYLNFLVETKDIGSAYERFWNDQNIPVGLGAVPVYQYILKGVPHLCFKVPTGGGKTYIACNAIKPIFERLPPSKAKAVVWLVPSDAILDQTVKNLKDINHPYRQKLSTDFHGNVEVYTKQELLSGQNFSPATIYDQLSVMVLSYDSFRSRSKEGLKAYQENSYLASFAKALGKPEQPIAKADETALFQIINQLNPLVIVDESHHARSDLSIEMLENFNPCFVLDLTATPKKESNIISFTDAAQLKKENMVKLPVIVYNRDKQEEVLADAVDLRNTLEDQAIIEQGQTGQYIRPIVLFQAQPKGKEESTTFEKLRERLEASGIPNEQIAIKTAEINELKNIDLLDEDCPIRYIITINALKEGWDCPFAYVLASLTNKTSQIDVEQILGRVLRQPYAHKHNHPALNMSYVITSSNDFGTTLESVVRGLNNAGFSERDCRVGSFQALSNKAPSETQSQILDQNDEEFLSFSTEEVKSMLAERQNTQSVETNTSTTKEMLLAAERAGLEYENSLGIYEDNNYLPWEIRAKMNTFELCPEFEEEALQISLPQFFIKVPLSIFADGEYEYLNPKALNEGFTLKGKSYDIDFSSVNDEIALVDVNSVEGSVPKVFKMSTCDQKNFKAYFNNLPIKSRKQQSASILFQHLNKSNDIDSGELQIFIKNIVDGLNEEQLAIFESSPFAFGEKIKKHIEALLEEHRQSQFDFWIATDRIVCQPTYKLPNANSLVNSTNLMAKSLYRAEGEMNGMERDLVMSLTAMHNVKWWHRIIERHGFCINGFINHYPDFMIMSQQGKVVIAETKGGHLKNDDSRAKITLGKAWEKAAGNNFRYYMIFQDSETPLENAVTVSQFLEILADL